MYKKTAAFLIGLILVTGLLFGEGQSDSAVVQRHYAFSNFDSLSVDGPFRVRILKSDVWDIHVSCAREDLISIKLRKHSEVFEISMAQGRNPALPSPVIVISMPDLREIFLNGAVQMEAGGFSSDSELKAVINPGAFLNLSGFECSSADFYIKGPSEMHAFLSAVSIRIFSEGTSIVRMGGRAEHLLVDSKGRARIDGSLLLVDIVDLQLEGISEVRITPDIEMNINSRDNAVIYYSDKYMDSPPVTVGNAILRKY